METSWFEPELDKDIEDMLEESLKDWLEYLEMTESEDAMAVDEFSEPLTDLDHEDPQPG